MAMHVFTVKMDPVDSPKGVVRDFLFDIAVHIELYDGWGGGWLGNVFFEVYRDDFEDQARDYASERGLSEQDKATLVSWVKNLPWGDGDDLSLNVNW